SSQYNVCDSAPMMNAIANQGVHSGSPLNLTLSAFDPDGDPLTYSASDLPSGSSFYADSRTFTWTPHDSDVGVHPGVRFTVSDGFSTDSRTITIGVAPRSASGPSTTTIHVGRTPSTLELRGTVSPDHRNFEIVVRMLRKIRGGYQIIAQQRAVLDQASSYHVSFARTSGMCEVRARFLGDDLHRTSVAIQDVAC